MISRRVYYILAMITLSFLITSLFCKVNVNTTISLTEERVIFKFQNIGYWQANDIYLNFTIEIKTFHLLNDTNVFFINETSKELPNLGNYEKTTFLMNISGYSQTIEEISMNYAIKFNIGNKIIFQSDSFSFSTGFNSKFNKDFERDLFLSFLSKNPVIFHIFTILNFTFVTCLGIISFYMKRIIQIFHRLVQ